MQATRLGFTWRGVHIVLAISAVGAWAAPAVQGGEIRWRSGAAETEFTAPAQAARAAAAMHALRSGDSHIVVQFDRPLGNGERAELSVAGIKLLNYVGDNAYFAAIADGGVDEVRLAGVQPLRVVRAVERDWKLHPSLVADEIQDWAIVAPADKVADADDPIVGAYVLFHPDVDLLTDGVEAVRGFQARIRSALRSVNGLVIELPASQIKALAEDDRVQYIEPPLPKLAELNDSNRIITEADIVQAAPYNLDGSGVSVLVYDGGTVRASHVDFGGRATVRDSSGMSTHPTHVAGTVGGDGSASGGLRRGMAPGVTIESYGFEMPGGLSEGFLYTDPGDIEADYSEAISVYGADISNNSIGTNTAPNGFPCSWEGDYGVTSTVIDTIVRGDGSNALFSTPFRVVWANGNERSSGACGTTYHTTAPPACAKNHITVGALNSNDDSVTSFTSWGPADDGRIKPDIAGPGCQASDDFDVTSLSDSGDSAYTGMCGTSMASPTVCGLAALILQDFRAQFAGEPDPRNSTLKVLFAHSAEDIVTPGPDYQSGYGSVRVERAINLMRSENFLEESVSQGDTYSVIVLVDAGAPEFQATIAWDDVPGTPNVDPALVNDLDLRVFAPNGTRHYPWTLDPNAPSNAATRNQEDHINNIEQVTVANPASGAWRIEVHGFNVPQGPQPFSLVATPLLVNCGDAGIVTLDRSSYPCDATASIRVVDCGLNTSDLVIDTVTVLVASDTESAGESVVLTETAAEAATFIGTLPLATADAAGVLQVSPGDTVTATYIDADDGVGGVNVVVTATAGVDCTAPAITSVLATDLEPRSATITFNTDEPARGTVRYGTHCGALTESAVANGLNQAHSLALSGLTDSTTYYFAVDAEDAAGNVTTDDAEGACYPFATPDIPDFFTELFISDNDLTNRLLTFTPNATVDEYAGCVETITALPTNPATGTAVTLDDDDDATVTLSGGQAVTLYGVGYTQFYIVSNGYLTFGTADTTYTETLADHFGMPRISALFDDLNPSSGGRVSWQQFADRVVVTWENVPQYNTSDANTFQIEMFFDGTIRIAYLAIAAADGIAGLSEGVGLDPDFYETDLTGMGPCGPQAPVANGSSVSTPANVSVNVVLQSSDDGLPDPPAAVDTIITALPTKGALADPNAGAITAVPYTLAAGGDLVTYTPGTNLYGPDQFRFKANDGDVPPDGGDSNEATIAITILADPPVTEAMNVSCDIDTPDQMALVASDPNGDSLAYVVMTLPAYGTLSDPQAGAIAAVPYTLANGGNLVTYAPAPGYAGPDTFSFQASDGIFQSNTSDVAILVVAAPPAITTTVLPDGVVGEPYGPMQIEKTGGQPDVAWTLITDPVYVETDMGTCGFAETGIAQGWQGDDRFWNLDLPFTFPFYNQNYDAIRVWSNGFIDFGTHSGSSYSNTALLLISNRRIAPLWDDLKTNQTGGDIFLDTDTSGEITIRWKGTVYVTTVEVNVAVTLSENGDIFFHYGEGNAVMTPTIGVSDGNGSSYTFSAYDGAGALTQANSMRLRIPVSLPAGVTVDEDGVVSGTPTEAGAYAPLMRLDDSLDRSDQASIALLVVSPDGAAGDYDGDGDADLADFAVFANCLSGPNATPSPALSATASSCLAVFDADGDGDVDLQDMAKLEAPFAGP